MAGPPDPGVPDLRVVLGRVGKAHGIKGWVKLHSFTEPVDNILDYSALSTEAGGRRRELEIDQATKSGRGLIVHFKGVDDPEAARLLTGAELTVSSAQLPQLEAGDYYWHELEGMLVWNQADELLGEVLHLLETGANDVLVVRPTTASIDSRERLIPYLADTVVKLVDKGANKIQVDWPADYLE